MSYIISLNCVDFDSTAAHTAQRSEIETHRLRCIWCRVTNTWNRTISWVMIGIGQTPLIRFPIVVHVLKQKNCERQKRIENKTTTAIFLCRLHFTRIYQYLFDDKSNVNTQLMEILKNKPFFPIETYARQRLLWLNERIECNRRKTKTIMCRFCRSNSFISTIFYYFAFVPIVFDDIYDFLFSVAFLCFDQFTVFFWQKQYAFVLRFCISKIFNFFLQTRTEMELITFWLANNEHLIE